MCLAIPAKVIAIKEQRKDEKLEGVVETVMGVRRNISFELLDSVKIGQYVFTQENYAISIISEKKASEIKNIINPPKEKTSTETKSDKKKTISLTIPEKLYKRLKKTSQEEKLPMTQIVKTLLESGLTE